ncbi:MAG TPA: hypothetical protein VHP83_09490 [Aggregatilineaceae bacterium]|nr:hypothetical protein [Aggregatilineaceae bacterium]
MNRTIIWLIDILGLIGLIALSVLAALTPQSDGYIVGQIVCAGIVLLSTFFLRRLDT